MSPCSTWAPSADTSVTNQSVINKEKNVKSHFERHDIDILVDFPRTRALVSASLVCMWIPHNSTWVIFSSWFFFVLFNILIVLNSFGFLFFSTRERKPKRDGVTSVFLRSSLWGVVDVGRKSLQCFPVSATVHEWLVKPNCSTTHTSSCRSQFDAFEARRV